MALYTYDSKEVNLYIGFVEVTGYGPDTKIVINREDDLITRTKGVDGDLQLNKQNMADGTMTVTLLYGCEWDIAFDQLSASKGVAPLTFVNAKGGKVLVTNAWIEQQPDISLGTEAEAREWVIGLQSTDFSAQGNTSSIKAAYEFLEDSTVGSLT